MIRPRLLASCQSPPSTSAHIREFPELRVAQQSLIRPRLLASFQLSSSTSAWRILREFSELKPQNKPDSTSTFSLLPNTMRQTITPYSHPRRSPIPHYALEILRTHPLTSHHRYSSMKSSRMMTTPETSSRLCSGTGAPLDTMDR